MILQNWIRNSLLKTNYVIYKFNYRDWRMKTMCILIGIIQIQPTQGHDWQNEESLNLFILHAVSRDRVTREQVDWSNGGINRTGRISSLSEANAAHPITTAFFILAHFLPLGEALLGDYGSPTQPLFSDIDMYSLLFYLSIPHFNSTLTTLISVSSRSFDSTHV